jgi:glucose/arabinose dehydrogenase
VDLASRKILVGESITNGFPSLYQSHGIGSLVFGADGTLLVSCGDGSSYSSTDAGSASETYFSRALTEGIIRSKENIGAFVLSSWIRFRANHPHRSRNRRRCSGNPFFDPASRAAARSRVWCLGLRNPFHVTLRPGTGSQRPTNANPACST